jgi:hypothetical protein
LTKEKEKCDKGHSQRGNDLSQHSSGRNRGLDNCQEFLTKEQLGFYIYKDELVMSPHIEITSDNKCKSIAILDTGSKKFFFCLRGFT